MSDGAKTMCDGCALRRDTWSEEYQEQGYNGCAMLLSAPPFYTEEDLWLYIDTNVSGDILGLGWIRNGEGRVINSQLITRNVLSCKRRME